MSKVMTWAEIEAEFDGEWVLIEDPETTPGHQVIQGRVIFHSKDRKEVHERIMSLPKLSHAVLFVGQPSVDMVFAL